MAAEATHDMFSIPHFNLNSIQKVHDPLFYGYEKDELDLKGKEELFFEALARQIDHSVLCSDRGGVYSQDDPFKSLLQTQLTESDYQESYVKPEKETSPPSSHPSYTLSSLELLRNYESEFKKLKGNQLETDTSAKESNSAKKLSTEEVMRIAGARYIQFSDERYDEYSMVMHPFGHALSGLSEEETQDVELAHLLLNAAEKVGFQQFQRASRLLSRCEWIASQQGNPVQRIVHYFAVALRERIDRETGISIQNQQKSSTTTGLNNGIGYSLTSLKIHQKLPFGQVMQFTAVQSLLENVGSAKKIHLIDLEIRSGVHWTAFMQALGDRRQNPVEVLKITAIGSSVNSRQIEEIGKQLSNFAESMNIPFSFTVVCVSSMDDIREEMFDIKQDESLAVLSKVFMRTLLAKPSSMEHLMRVIKNLNPVIMVIVEVEVNHNSPSFFNRFIEALFFYSAHFDCLETCLDRTDEHRINTEEIFCSGIRNIVAMEGKERHVRNVKLDVWKAFFARFKMVEVGLSDSALYQASLVSKRFHCGKSVDLENNGKGLIIGWKGTPLYSVSAWKFSKEKWRSFINYGFQTQRFSNIKSQ